jgi:RNA polymerase sigma factor (sigma-70 family)
MYNPFREDPGQESDERVLVEKALGGDSGALESLVLRHQAWIYNIAFRMSGDRTDAEDITQEVLIKVITRLSLYDPGRASLRTWMYRIVVNHIINAGKSAKEILVQRTMKEKDFGQYAAKIADKRPLSRPEASVLNEEVRISCIQCMVLCLSRRERMVFILGVVFGVTDAVGGELCGVSKANFRAILSRSRRKVFEFFNRRCGLLREENPCRCGSKSDLLLAMGLVEPDDPMTGRAAYGRVGDIIAPAMRAIEDSYYEFTALFRDQPFLKSPDMTAWLQTLFERDDVSAIFGVKH